MKLLALDPSTTKTGYALMADRDTIIDAGLFTPKRVADKSLVRVDAMVADLRQFLKDSKPTAAVIEMPSGKMTGYNSGRGAGQAVYGVAAGRMYQVLIDWLGPDCVTAYTPTEWTRGKQQKARQRIIKNQFAVYDVAKDKGCNVSDAIGIGLYWFSLQHGG